MGGRVLGVEGDGLFGFVEGLLEEGGSGGGRGGGSGLGEELGADDEVALGLRFGFVAEAEAEIGEELLGDVVDGKEGDDDDEDEACLEKQVFNHLRHHFGIELDWTGPDCFGCLCVGLGILFVNCEIGIRL